MDDQPAAITPIGFHELYLIRKRVHLTEEGAAVPLQFDVLNVDDSRFSGLITSIHHVAGVTYDVVIAVSVLQDEYLEQVRQAIAEGRLAAFESLETDE